MNGRLTPILTQGLNEMTIS